MTTRQEAEAAVRTLLTYVGEDPDREGLRDTPARVVRSYDRLLGGYASDTAALLERSFTAEGYDQMVMLRGIEFWSQCEHHWIPFYGTATIGYLPDKRVVGVSKLARVVEAFARRLQIQERMTQQIADALQGFGVRGVGVLVRAQHLCMVARGVEKQRSWMVTSALRGTFLQPEVRAEFLALAADEEGRR